MARKGIPGKMRKTLAVLLSVVMACAMLCSCQVPVQPDKATRVDQVLNDMDGWSTELPLYSELKNDSKYLGYFGLLRDQFSYLIFDIKGSKYMFILYMYYDYSSAMDKVTGVEQHFNGKTLSLTFDTEVHDAQKGGCFPSGEYARCILKIDDDFNPGTCEVQVTGYGTQPITEYQGGMFSIGKKWGMADKDLNIVLPVIYDGILEFESDRVEDYYRVILDGNNGLVDSDGNIVLQPVYSNLICVNADRFIVMKDEGDTNMIGLVDSRENVIKDFIPGFIEMQRSGIYNTADQYIFSRFSEGEYLEGVIDADFNIVIEPVYEYIATYYQDSPNMYYAAQNTKGKFAVIGTDGVLRNDFVFDSAYDASQEYFERMGGYSYF